MDGVQHSFSHIECEIATLCCVRLIRTFTQTEGYWNQVQAELVSNQHCTYPSGSKPGPTVSHSGIVPALIFKMMFAETISTSAPQTKALENLSKAPGTFQKIICVQT